MKKAIILLGLILFVSCSNRETIVDKTTLLGVDYRLFQSTIVWDLAKAVEDGNTRKIKYLVQEKKLSVDFQEERFGQTLLLIAVSRNQKKTVKTLLELGADPNKKDTYSGTSPIIEASGRIGFSSDNPHVLKLLLQYGGNPSDVEIGGWRTQGAQETPLIKASMYSLEKVKLLVEAGADVNYTNTLGSPLGYALLFEKMDIVLYLLEHGADFISPVRFGLEQEPRYICEELQLCVVPKGSKSYKDKMKIKSFLMERGVDCQNTPITDFFLQKIQRLYPKSWREYLED